MRIFMAKKYSIGLDIGTTSVGWAVVNEDDELVRYKKKNMWGSRLFEEAEKAEGRRMNRSARRRLKRREQRINFLQNIMSPMVLPVDNSFFIKLNESMLYDDDKKYDPLKTSLQDAGYLEKTKAAPKKYPTIYHLRKDLIESDEKVDPRLIYMAIHHIIKYRGNFLYQGQKFNINNTQEVDENLTQIFEFLEDNFGISLDDLNGKRSEIIAILRQSNKSKSQRKSDIVALFKLEKSQKNALEQVVKAFLGLTVNLHQLFDIDKQSLDFSKFEEKRDISDESLQSLNDEQIEYLDLLQKVYSWVILQGVLRGESSISQAMINKYDDYARDLKYVKNLFKKYLSKEDYKEYFKSKQDSKGEYTHYTKYSESGWNYDEFIKDFKKYYEKAVKNGADTTTPEVKRFAARLENKEAFSKLRISDNGAIPYQLHKDELVKIIKKQGKFYPELLEKVDNGDRRMEYKLVRLLEYRIPYYVGPLQTTNQNNSDFAWMKRQAAGDITPFNFYQKVDKIGSAESFIERLTNNCTYLPDKPVLPKNSLLFSEFVVRNEIKNIRINGEQPSIDLENKIFEDLFLKKKKVTKKDVLQYLKNTHYPIIKTMGDPEVSGLASETHFNSSMSSYIDFMEKIGLDISLDINSPVYTMTESLIKWITIFEDKKILAEKIKKEYGDRLSKEQIQNICKLNYSGWASLSRELLVDVKNRPDESELGQSIIELMRSEKFNFMQIISKQPIKGKLKQALIEAVGDTDKITYQNIVDLPASPGVKRGIWQAVQLVDEIVELHDGKKPEKIYIEMARGSNGFGRTQNRKRQLEKVYDKIEVDSQYYTKEEVKQARDELKELQKVDSDALMLYFQQLGKCVYSGKTINLNTLTQTCQIDHVLPQSLIKDNSLDNRVLVLTGENQRKRETYPLDPEIVKSRIGLWKYWLDNKLISPAKFARLTKTQEKYEQEKMSGGFIARQLVETRQITKHVAVLLNRRYGTDQDQEIVEPIKARITSEFRDKFDFPKSRSINDFHHAKDAYLAAVLERFLAQKFPNRSRNNLYDRYMKFANESRETRESRETGFVLYGIDKKEVTNTETGEIIDGETRMNTIRRIMRFNDCLVTKKAETSQDGELFNATIYKKENLANAKIARTKGLPVSKYGGHTSDKTAYLAAVELTDSKGKIIRKLVKIPIRIALSSQSNDKLTEWLKKEHVTQNVKIIKNNIPKYQIIGTKDNSILILTSQADAGNFKQLHLPYDVEKRYAHFQKVFPGLNEINLSDATLARRVYKKLPDLVNRVGDLENYQYEFKPNAANSINKFFDEFYQTLLGKISDHIKFYGDRMIQKLRDFYDIFSASDNIAQKFQFLEQMLVLTSADARYPAFEKLEISRKYFKSSTGKMTEKTFYLDDITFYDYSITGLKVKKTKL